MTSYTRYHYLGNTEMDAHDARETVPLQIARKGRRISRNIECDKPFQVVFRLPINVLLP
jgi:hypothetical protein